ncbi:hypothetical protein H8L32_26390 [Undibacterium sp. CY18W]|uniref:Uncharacterized protein n=1 Tax=Undibacterium hunanense TaxID=2762292 RepID=A0ABR6ZYQ9_9BURK|nr:hypothetical protein [Undibacterium hunanense]MBC3921021.1 hypothetical protein [Undibacterium hunanense]
MSQSWRTTLMSSFPFCVSAQAPPLIALTFYLRVYGFLLFDVTTLIFPDDNFVEIKCGLVGKLYQQASFDLKTGIAAATSEVCNIHPLCITFLPKTKIAHSQ